MSIQCKKKYKLAVTDFKKAVTLNNDAVGVHYVKGLMFEAQKNKTQAAQEFRAFVKDADIVYYDVEIISALNWIVKLEEAS